jgi:hypothetical protein
MTTHIDLQGNPTINLAGGLDLNGNLLSNISGDLLHNIGVNVALPVIKLDPIKLDVGISNLPKIVTDSTLTSDSKVALDLNVRVKELPKIELEFGFKPMRVHLPTHYQMCFSLFGKEVFKFALCGESMIACEPYLPHQTEKCG